MRISDWSSDVCSSDLAFGGGLAEKAEVVALNKVDALDAETREQKQAALRKAIGKDAGRAELLCLSGVSGEGIEAVVARLWQHIVTERRRRREAADTAERSFRP